MSSPRDLVDLDAEMAPSERYAVDDDTVAGKSRVGMAIGAIFISVFVFLKETLLPASADTQRDAGRSGDDYHGGNIAPVPLELAELSNISSETGTPRSGDNDLRADAGPSSIGSNSQPAHRFDAPNSPAAPDGGQVPFQVSDLLQAENDNPLRAPVPFNQLGLSDLIDISRSNSGDVAGAGVGADSVQRAVTNGDSIDIEDTPDGQPGDSGPGDAGGNGDGSGSGTDDDGDAPPGSRPNRAPSITSPVLFEPLLVNQSIVIATAFLLQNAIDPDGDALSIENVQASSGTLEPMDDVVWQYTPELGFIGDVELSYNVSDGEYNVPQFALLNFAEITGETIVGTQFADMLAGTEGDDFIDGFGGDDRIEGLGGNDVINAGAGDDEVVSGDGDKIIIGGLGNDRLFGGSGADTIFGNAGDDTIFGDDGDDTLSGGEGDDTLSGGNGNDFIDGGGGDDHLMGDAGNDILLAGPGNDIVDGGDGDDTIVAGSGKDIAKGGKGNDEFIALVDDDDDAYEGDEGIDTYDMSRTNSDATVDLTLGTASSTETGNDTLTAIENVVGSAGDDLVVGSIEDNGLWGGAGDDILIGGDGNDMLMGGEGDDVFIATVGDGDDVYDGGDDYDTYDLSMTSADAMVDLHTGFATGVEIGTDQISGFENVIGGSGNDIIIANAEANELHGGAGNDIFVFLTVEDARGNGKYHDRIEDFEVGDKIDISFIDANDDEDDNQSFEFVLDSNSQLESGSLVLRFEGDDDDDATAINTIIAGFISSDQLPDFEISISGKHNLEVTDFIGVIPYEHA